MVMDGFGSGIGLVWIFGSSLLVSSVVLYRATTPVLYRTTTLVLCGATTVVLCRTHIPLWLSFHSIGWIGMWLVLG
jgi:hypothetical protein